MIFESEVKPPQDTQPVEPEPEQPQPQTPPPSAICESGAFINPSGEAVEWMCSCTAADPIFHRSGWVKTANNFSQRIANSFCGGGKIVYWVCNHKSLPTGKGWVPQPNNCYHLGTARTCN